MSALSTAVAVPAALPALPLPDAGPLTERGWGESAAPAEHAPMRCRLGLHSWLPLALSLPGAQATLSVSFCRCCPAVRRV